MSYNLNELFNNPALHFSNDFIFKTVFTSPDDNYIILRSLIHSVLGGPEITKLQILNTEETLEAEQMKQIRYDIKAELETGEAIEIEMQKASSRSELKERAAYYASRLYAKQEARGFRYRDIKSAYSIILCDFPFFEDKNKWKAVYSFMDEENPKDILTQKVKVIIIEIDKGHLFEHLPIEQLTALQQWIILLGMKNANQAQAIIKKEPILEKAVDKLRKITQSEIEQAIAESRYKFEVDEIAFRLSAETDGKAKGLAEGRSQGEKETKYQIAQKMVNKNIDDALIIEFTGLSQEQLNTIKSKQ